MLAQQILAGTPVNRLADLAARKQAGTLTALESLALCVLRGGNEGEEAAPGLIDEALATYGHGGYRVPVRVIADARRLLLVATVPPTWSDDQSKRGADALKTAALRLVAQDEPQAITLPAGCKLEVYEVADPAQAGVRVNGQRQTEGG